MAVFYFRLFLKDFYLCSDEMETSHCLSPCLRLCFPAHEKQKQLLYAIALDGEAEGITSSTFIKRHSLDSASSVQAATKRLLEKDLLTKEDKIYRLTDRLFTLWIKRLHGKDLF